MERIGTKTKTAAASGVQGKRPEQPFQISVQTGSQYRDVGAGRSQGNSGNGHRLGDTEKPPLESSELRSPCAEVLSVRIAQQILRLRTPELWNSVSICCETEPTGALVVRVLVFNPDWEGGLQIAELRSWPSDSANLTPLGCNLDHIGAQV